jgi:hypothetical protein
MSYENKKIAAMPRLESQGSTQGPSQTPAVAEQAEQLMRQRPANHRLPINEHNEKQSFGAKLPSLWPRTCPGDWSLALWDGWC